MNKKSQLVLKTKLKKLFNDAQNSKDSVKICGDELVNRLKSYSKEEIDYILNDEYYLIKFISRLNDYPESMWSGRMLKLFKIAITTLKEIQKNLNIKYKITPRLLINSLNIESLIEISNFLEDKEKSENIREELNKYLEDLPGFVDIKTPLSERTKVQHELLVLQVTEKIEKLENFFNYNKTCFVNLKKLRMYEKVSNF